MESSKAHNCRFCKEVKTLLVGIKSDGNDYHPISLEDWPTTPVPEYKSWTTLPVSWETAPFQNQAIQLPPQMICLWHHAGEVNLFREIHYRLWGILLLTPLESLQKTDTWQKLFPDNFITGDLVIGEWLGDDRFVVLRCDEIALDWGSVLIGVPLEARKDWYVVSRSVLQFIKHSLLSPGVPFWER